MTTLRKEIDDKSKYEPAMTIPTIVVRDIIFPTTPISKNNNIYKFFLIKEALTFIIYARLSNTQEKRIPAVSKPTPMPYKRGFFSKYSGSIPVIALSTAFCNT